MAVDRGKFKPTKVSKLKKQEQKAQETTSFGGGKYPERFKSKEGKTKYRILPAHPNSPEDTASYVQQCTVHFLPYYAEEKKDGETKKVLKNRSIFNSRIHGGTKKDIVDEYIKLVYKQEGAKITDKDELAKRLAPVKGYKSKDGKWTPGLLAASTWELYALELNDSSDSEDFDSFKFGQLSLNSTCRNGLNEILEDESSNQPMGTDPFTDPDEGMPITRKYDKSKSGSDAYSITLPRKEAAFPLSDEVLAKLLDTPSLEERYVNSYKKKDFEKAYESLELFDELNKFNIFELEEWDEIVEEISAFYPEGDIEDSEEEEEKPKKNTVSTKPKVSTAKTSTKKAPVVEDEEQEEEESEEEEVDLDLMDRKGLKAYIADKELDIRVLPNMTDEDLRERIKLLEKPADKLPFKEEEDEQVEEETPPPSSRRTSTRRTIGQK